MKLIHTKYITVHIYEENVAPLEVLWDIPKDTWYIGTECILFQWDDESRKVTLPTI